MRARWQYSAERKIQVCRIYTACSYRKLKRRYIWPCYYLACSAQKTTALNRAAPDITRYKIWSFRSYFEHASCTGNCSHRNTVRNIHTLFWRKLFRPSSSIPRIWILMNRQFIFMQSFQKGLLNMPNTSQWLVNTALYR